MINVDIVEQLIPNPATMAATLCSVLVLFLLVRKFLWPSVKRYLNARADAMQEELEKSKDNVAMMRKRTENRQEVNWRMLPGVEKRLSPSPSVKRRMKRKPFLIKQKWKQTLCGKKPGNRWKKNATKCILPCRKRLWMLLLRQLES